MSSREALKSRVRNYVNSVVPGLYFTLNIICLRDYGRECINLLLDEPSKFKDSIMSIYNDLSTFEYILATYIAPLIHARVDNDEVKDLVKLLMEDPDEFKIRIRNYLRLREP